MKSKKVTKKMISSSFYQIECTCGCDAVESLNTGSFYIELGDIGKCHECDQEWEVK